MGEPPEPLLIAVGAARLPRAVGGACGSLMVELVLDPADSSILDVATTISLPGYTALLKRLLIGRRLDDVGAVARDLCARCRGPLLRPTIAALANAAANSNSGAYLE